MKVSSVSPIKPPVPQHNVTAVPQHQAKKSPIEPPKTQGPVGQHVDIKA